MKKKNDTFDVAFNGISVSKKTKGEILNCKTCPGKFLKTRTKQKSCLICVARGKVV